MRIELITVQRSTTLELMTEGRPSPVDPEELAILNGVTLFDPIDPGRVIKWVVGEAPPGS